MPWQQRMYDIMYRRGTPRWETGVIPSPLVDLIEGEKALPAGRALDLGCGTGAHSIYLAEHGWEAVGIDFSAVAIRAAQASAVSADSVRAAQAGDGEVRGVSLVQGDVTRLSEQSSRGPFDLVLDVGCFHGIPSARRAAYVDEVARVTRPGAIFLLWAIDSQRRSWVPGAPRARESEIRRRFEPRFSVLSAQPGDMVGHDAGKARWPAKWYVVQRQG